MRKTIYILDGYNVIHRVPVLRNCLSSGAVSGRRALLAYCAQWMALRRDAWLFYVVFDGDSTVDSAGECAAPGVRVVFTASGETADRRVIGLVSERAHDARCVVVSDDREVLRRAKAEGADSLSAEAFFAVCRGVRSGNPEESDGKPDLPPLARKAINDELLAAWSRDSSGG